MLFIASTRKGSQTEATSHKEEQAMTVDNKHNFANAQVLVDNDDVSYAPSILETTAEQPVFTTVVAEPVFDADTKEEGTLSNSSASVAPKQRNHNVATPRRQCQDHTITDHNVQHKRNVVTGIISGVVIGALLLGPVGAIAGGFIGSSIVNRREQRWCHRHHRTHDFGSSTSSSSSSCSSRVMRVEYQVIS